MAFLDESDLRNALRISNANWDLWRDDFEFNGDNSRLPVLTQPYRFCCFCRDYSLLRHQSSQVVERVRSELVYSPKFKLMLQDRTGKKLDDLAEELASRVGGIKKERSLLSKLAAFAQPATFIAWDRFARRGAKYIASQITSPSPPRGRMRAPKGKYTPYRTYESYLADVSAILDSDVGEEIGRTTGADPRGRAYTLRVLDCYLMTVGNRWAPL